MNSDIFNDESSAYIPNAAPVFESDLDIQRLLPPHSIEAEQAVIGGLLLANDRWDDVADLLTDTDFYRADHRHIFRAMQLLVDAEMPLDVVTLIDKLGNLELLEKTGGLPYLAELALNTPSAANIRAYAVAVQEKSLSRQLLLAANHIEKITRNPDGRAAADIIAEAERQLIDIAEGRAKEGGPQDINPILKASVEQI